MIGPVIGHLGPRVSALLDGQLSPADEERAWEHVHSCHLCRDAVEREGWVKTRLATMQYAGSDGAVPPQGLAALPGDRRRLGRPARRRLWSARRGAARSRRHLGLTGHQQRCRGRAVMGVLALGASPANAPGAIVRPSGESFGTSLTNAITTIVDREHLTAPVMARSASVRTPRRSCGALRRTLAP